jgi:hypothetical protein
MGDVENSNKIITDYAGDVSTTPVMKKAYKEFMINSTG